MPSELTTTYVLLVLVAILFGGNLWWMRRLVASNDAFRRGVYTRLAELEIHRARVEERHRQEDDGRFGRREYDHRPGAGGG